VERDTAERELVELARFVEEVVISSATGDPELVKLLLLPPRLYTHYGRVAPSLEDVRPHRHHALIEVEFTAPVRT